MAQNLRLKSQSYSTKKEFSFAIEVLVDSGVAHLSKPYTYAVATNDARVDIGSLVTVPFSSKVLSGIVVSKNSKSIGALKFIKKVVHSNPILNAEQIELISKSAHRWGANFWDFVKFAVPKIPNKVEVPLPADQGILRKVEQPILKIGTGYPDFLDLIQNRINPSRQLLVIVPEVRDIDFLRSKIKSKFIEYGSHLANIERYENYIKILSGELNLIISTRSGIFLPLKADSEILILDELAFSFYESRYPYWNVRDVALLRAAHHSITFYSHSPSLELARLVESGWLKLRTKKTLRTPCFFSDSRISYQTLVKSALEKGAVLILVPEKGYVNSLVCAKCRNIRKCDLCGGRLQLNSINSKPECALCLQKAKNESCSYCGSDLLLSFRKGIEKNLEELGKQFPNTPIRKYVSGDFVPKRGEIVISTFSQYPISEFDAVIALGLEKYLYRSYLRSNEFGRNLIFNLRALQPKSLFLELKESDYFARALQLGNSYQDALKELADRQSAKLPPDYKIVLIEADSRAAEVFAEQNFIESVNYQAGRVIVKTKVENLGKLTALIREIVNYRSIRKLKPWGVKIDPIDI